MNHYPLRAALVALTAILSPSITSARQCLVTKLTADDARPENQFGHALAVQGDEIFVGSPLENVAGKDSGSVHVLRRVGLSWFLEAKLTAPDAKQRLAFGTRIAVDKDTLVVASGPSAPALYVYERAGRAWNLAVKLLPQSPLDLGAGFGHALALRGDWIFVGAPLDSSAGLQAGAIHAYRRADAGWSPAGRIVPADIEPQEHFGSALAAWGDRFIATSPWDDLASHGGSAYVFERIDSDWIQRQKLVVQGPPGNTFGASVALRAETLVVGASAAAYVFEGAGGTWVESARLTADTFANFFGRSVALTDEHVLVSTDRHPEGSVFAFRRGSLEAGAARLQPDDVTNGAYIDRFGWNLAASSDLAVVSADNSSQRASGAGAVFVYSLSGAACATLSSPRELSWGKQRLELDRGAEHAGHVYRMLGSLSGTSRGLPFRGTRIPLNHDWYFALLLRTPQLAPFTTMGVLDGNGRASLVLQVPPESYSYVVGLTLDHAFLERGPFGFEHVSNAVQVRFGPRP